MLYAYRKQSFMERWLSKMKDSYCAGTWNNFSKVLWQSWLDHIGTRNLPCPMGGRTNDRSVRSIQERQRRSSLSSFDYKNVPTESLGQCNTCLPACEPYKRPSLLNHFLSITLPLTEFFSVLRHKGLSYWSPQNNTKPFCYYKICICSLPWNLSHSKGHSKFHDLFSAGEQVNSAWNLIVLLLQGQEPETFCIFQYQTQHGVNLIWITDWIYVYIIHGPRWY